MADKAPRPQLKCLIVDDDEDDAFLLKSHLHDIASAGITVRWESSCEQALAALSDSTYTVCFVDYLLGEPNGIEFIQAALRTGTTVPLILVTGSSDPAVDAEAAAAGATDFIAKDDLSARTVARTIRFALTNRQKNEALRRSQAELQETMAALDAERSLLQFAINNTSLGVAVFGDNNRLTICNSKYREIPGFSDDIVRPGAEMKAIVREVVALAEFQDQEATRVVNQRIQQINMRQPVSYRQTLRDGRTIVVSHLPTGDGPSISTCEDITNALERENRFTALARSAALFLERQGKSEGSKQLVAAAERMRSQIDATLREMGPEGSASPRKAKTRKRSRA